MMLIPRSSMQGAWSWWRGAAVLPAWTRTQSCSSRLGTPTPRSPNQQSKSHLPPLWGRWHLPEMGHAFPPGRRRVGRTVRRWTACPQTP